MQKKHIISAALAVASLTSVALAGTAAPVVPLSVPPAPKVFSGALNVGYSSNYDFRGLVLSTSDGENMTPISLDTRYKVSRTTDITADFGYKAIWDKDIVQDNEFDFNLGVENKLNNYVIARLGYGLFQGGLPGIISQAEGNHSVSQEFNGGFRYDINGIGQDGWFVGANAHYSFSGMTGWWFDASVGYKKHLTQRLSGIISGTYWSTASYFDAKTPGMSNGSQSYSLNLQLPYSVTKNLTFSPFVSAIWSGNGARKDGSELYGSRAIKDFTVAAGAMLSYSF